jgi:anti-sigma factor RsiW
MCDFSEKLVAWIDHELPVDESDDVERHLKTCPECRSRLDAYKEISSAFDAYCEAAMASNERRRVPRSVLAVAGAAAVLALILVHPHARVTQPPAALVVAANSSAVVLEAAPVQMTRVHRRHVVAPVSRREANWQPAIQITIPAEALLPPGAAPEGINFVADLSIVADGSAQRVRLEPELIGFERRQTQP